jgi:uncharacterized protein with GYD domain
MFSVAHFVVLFNWTEQGIKGFRDSPARVEAAQADLERAGVTIREVYWTVGQYDLVGLVDARDGETLTAGLLQLGAAGNVRTTTLRAFNAAEFKEIVAKLG